MNSMCTIQRIVRQTFNVAEIEKLISIKLTWNEFKLFFHTVTRFFLHKLAIGSELLGCDNWSNFDDFFFLPFSYNIFVRFFFAENWKSSMKITNARFRWEMIRVCITEPKICVRMKKKMDWICDGSSGVRFDVNRIWCWSFKLN